MTDAALEHQVASLRARLGRSASHPERPRDARELEAVEGEIRKRAAAREAEARAAHGGVEICKRTADLPVAGALGLQHWWLKTTRKEAGMGQEDGTVPGHGESGPPNLRTRVVDHSQEPKTDCERVPGVDEDCVDRELQIGTDAGDWIPPLNDCHTFVKRIVDKCTKEAQEAAVQREEAAKTSEGHDGAP
jgi:hypothetical protein